MLRLAFLFLALNYSFNAIGQFYDNGQDPFIVNWQWLETENYRVIFPDGMQQKARIYGYYLELAHKNASKTLHASPKVLPVIIHNYTSITNGEVGWAPRRMNLYTVSGQDNAYQPWEQHLTVHEVRHNFQLTKLNQGFTKFLGFAFGEIAAGAVLGLHLPMWFIEGDAVAYETGTGSAGRGRDADFYKSLQAQLDAYGAYSYPKAIFGSYKDYTPGRYELGYYLVAKARTKYNDPMFWDDVMHTVATRPWHPNPFSKGIKDKTGLSERNFYFSALADLYNTRHKKTKDKPNYTNYYNPCRTKCGIVTLKTDYKNIPRFVETNASGHDHILTYPGTLLNYTFDGNDSLLIWNEYRPTRFAHLNYNNIVVYNRLNGKKKQLTTKSRIYASRLSPDAKRIVSVEFDANLHWLITLRDIEDGRILQTFTFNNQVITPVWSPDANRVLFIEISDQGKSLGILDIKSGQISWILKNQRLDISYPRWGDGFLLIRGTYQNTSNYFKYRFSDKKWQVVSNVAYRSGAGNIAGDWFYFSNYTASGYVIDSLPVNHAIRQLQPAIYSDELSEKIASQEQLINFEIPDSIRYKVHNYNRLAHLFHFHSWSPLAMRVNQEKVGLGVSLMAQNDLSTSFLEMGYHYRKDLGGYHEYYLSYDYKGFYPIIRLRNSFYTYRYQKPDADDIPRDLNYRVNRTQINVQLPFIFTKGVFTQNLYLTAGTFFNYAYYESTPYFITKTSYFNSFSGRFYFTNLRKRSVQDLYPKWGQMLNVYYEKAPFDTVNNYNFAAQAQLYFPGILPTHSMQCYGGYQKMKEADIAYMDELLFPRGVISPDFTQIKTARVSYALPLLYPDLNLSEVLYIKRVQTQLFFDYANYTASTGHKVVKTTGFELTTDLHAMRFIAPIHTGLQYARLLHDATNYFGFIFSLNFNELY